MTDDQGAMIDKQEEEKRLIRRLLGRHLVATRGSPFPRRCGGTCEHTPINDTLFDMYTCQKCGVVMRFKDWILYSSVCHKDRVVNRVSFPITKKLEE